MPVNDFLDIDIEGGDVSLEEMDKQVAKSIKQLKEQEKALKNSIKEGRKAEAEEKRLSGRGGIFNVSSDDDRKIPKGGVSPGDLLYNQKVKKTLNDIIDERLKKEKSKTKDDDKGLSNSIKKEMGGLDGAKNVFSFGRNPIGFMKGIMGKIPFLGGVVALAEFSKAVVEAVAELDAFFKKFISDRVDIRFNQLRKRTEEVGIKTGDIQEILSLSDGDVQPRVTYNSYISFNNREILNEQAIVLNDNSGV